MYKDIALYFILNNINLQMTCIYMYDIPDMYICMYVCMHVCMYACMYVCLYVAMYLCIYVSICMIYTKRDTYE